MIVSQVPEGPEEEVAVDPVKLDPCGRAMFGGGPNVLVQGRRQSRYGWELVLSSDGRTPAEDVYKFLSMMPDGKHIY